MSNLTTLKTLQSDQYYDVALKRWLSLGFNENTLAKEMTFAVKIISGSTTLQQSDATTVLNCILNIASCGLTLNPEMKRAYLVPFNEKTNQKDANGKDIYLKRCKVMPSYVGLHHLAVIGGMVQGIQTAIVYEGDEFDMWTEGMDTKIYHKSHKVIGTDKGNIKAVYSQARINEYYAHYELMSYKEIIHIRDNFSEAWKNALKNNETHKTVWTLHHEEMARKTVLKRHLKHLPNGLTENVSKAIELDNDVNGYNEEEATMTQIGLIEQFITHALLSPEEKIILQSQANQIKTKREAMFMIDFLKDYQEPTLNEQMKMKLELPNT